jgi:hypothetical protein
MTSTCSCVVDIECCRHPAFVDTGVIDVDVTRLILKSRAATNVTTIAVEQALQERPPPIAV